MDVVRRTARYFLVSICLIIFAAALFSPVSISAEEPLIRLRPELSQKQHPITLVEAVRLAENNYPKILQAQAEVRAAKRSVSLQRVREYNPDSLMTYQNVVATHNRLTQTLFSSPSLPATPGPGPENVEMKANVFSGAGFIVDWAPIDFGLHKARIDLSKAELGLTQAKFGVTLLDVTVEAASRYLDTLVMQEQIQVAKANVQRFADFSTVVHAKVDSGLKPGADASLADSQLANASNDLIRARLNYNLARASLAYLIGFGGQLIDIEPGGIVATTEPMDRQKTLPLFEEHPLAVVGKSAVSINLAKKRVLDKEYYPVFRWLGGVNLRGTTFNNNRGDVSSPDISGLFPVVPNWNVGLMIDFPFFDIIRIRAEKKVVGEHIIAAQRAYDLIMQRLKTEDVQSRVQVEAAVELAANMPIQVEAALMASKQAQARYEAGLATVAQVAEANQILADSRVKEAIANVGVWKALLAVANVHGSLRSFLVEADQATRRRRQ